MRTAVDASVLLDVFGSDPTFGERSRDALREAYDKGALVACDVTWAEVRAHFPSDASFEDAMRLVGIQFDPIGEEAARQAGQLWKKRRDRGVKRDRIVPDFLIGAHAQHQADALLSRDRGFYRSYFKDLLMIDPTHL
jgi:predicted nucleic acid-binding protein